VRCGNTEGPLSGGLFVFIAELPRYPSDMPRSFPVPGTRRITQKQMPFRSFTPEVRKIIIKAVGEGEYITSACRKARIGELTLRHWLTLGEASHKLVEEAAIKGEEVELSDKEVEFMQFYLDVYEAEGKNESDAVGELRRAGREDQNWVASITFLERRHGQRWKKREQTEHVGPGGGPIQHEEIDNSASKLAEVLTVLQDAGILPHGIKGLPEAADG
jgi:transposase-like protein